MMSAPRVRLDCDSHWRYLTQDGSNMYFWSSTPRFNGIWDTRPDEGTLMNVRGQPYPIITDKDRLKIVEIEHADSSG